MKKVTINVSEVLYCAVFQPWSMTPYPHGMNERKKYVLTFPKKDLDESWLLYGKTQYSEYFGQDVCSSEADHQPHRTSPSIFPFNGDFPTLDRLLRLCELSRVSPDKLIEGTAAKIEATPLEIPRSRHHGTLRRLHLIAVGIDVDAAIRNHEHLANSFSS